MDGREGGRGIFSGKNIGRVRRLAARGKCNINEHTDANTITKETLQYKLKNSRNCSVLNEKKVFASKNVKRRQDRRSREKRWKDTELLVGIEACFLLLANSIKST